MDDLLNGLLFSVLASWLLEHLVTGKQTCRLAGWLTVSLTLLAFKGCGKLVGLFIFTVFVDLGQLPLLT